MLNPKTIASLIKKELKSYFDSPTAYIILIVFLILWEYLFFRNVFIVGEASLRGLMTYVPWLFIILIPALTMGSISGERSEGTLEFLLTHPVKILELILGKFIASTLFVTIALLFIFPIAASLDQFGNLDWGVVIGQFLASVMVAAIFVSLGIFVSSLFTSQITALLVAATASFILVIMGFELITLSLPSSLASVFERISILSRFESMSRGVIDLRDVWYLLSTTVIFLSLAFLQLLRFRIGNQKQIFRQYTTAVFLFIGIAVMVNIVGARIPGRLDLTQEGIYQLTGTTKQTLENLDDVVNIRLYATSQLPAQLRPILRDTKDILRDYQLYGGNRIEVSIKDPSGDQQVAAEAAAAGIREVQFNVIGQEELQLKRGYLGLAVAYGGQTEIIPLISDASNLEYQLTSFIKKLTTDQKKTVAFVTGHGQKTTGDYASLTQELSNLYEITEIDLQPEEEDEPVTIPEDVTTLIVAGPVEPMPEEDRRLIADFFNQGGSVLLLLDGVIVNDATLTANTNNNSLADFIEAFGLSLGQDIVYDLQSSETVNFGSDAGTSFIIQYPFWPRAISADNSHPVSNRLKTMVLPWPSSLTINDSTISELGLEVSRLFTTTPSAGSQIGTYSIQPNQRIVPTELEEKTLAVSLLGKPQANDRVPRMIVVGDSNFLTESIVPNSPENIAFGLESVAWLSQEQSLAELQLKQTQQRNLIFQDQTQISLVKYGNLGFAFALPFLVGAVRIVTRRNLRFKTYGS